MGKLTLVAVALLLIPVRAESAVAITGGLGAAHAWRGYAVPFWMRLQNNNPETLTAIAVQVVGGEAQHATPEVTVAALCWTADAASQCAPTPGDLAPGAVMLLRGTISFRSSGEWRPALLVSWSPGPGKQMTNAVAIGNLKVESYGWS